ncbi:MAG: hypothetical protein COB67_12480 [SAR324 cluster bacterium]|uniref:Uncharacterized protein n=1 Tax=SAR324 cluster bacterium TaxID=2024889 RepID=A0A2A4SQJ7_9DELT|nr:MAG: hypothetical protein COB67_12480 [SAR324 cluster bacterium]
MEPKRLLIPVYCPNCENLSYFIKDSQDNKRLIEFKKGSWLEHPCGQMKGPSFWADPLLVELSEIQWGSQDLSFTLGEQKRSQRARSKPELGIVIELAPLGELGSKMQLLTVDETLIEVRTAEDPKSLSVGMLLDLKHLIRVGKDKYRLATLEQASLPEVFFQTVEVPKEYYQLTLSAEDPSLLETFTNRFLQFFVEQDFPAFSVTPLPVDRQDDKQLHHRRICLCPGPHLMEKFREISLPDTIQVSMQQIRS